MQTSIPSGASTIAGMPDIAMNAIREISQFTTQLIRRSAATENLLSAADVAEKMLLGATMNPANGRVVEKTWVDYFYTVIPQAILSGLNYRHFWEDLIKDALFHLVESPSKSLGTNISFMPLGLTELVGGERLNHLVRNLFQIHKTAFNNLTTDPHSNLYYELKGFLDRDEKGW